MWTAVGLCLCFHEAGREGIKRVIQCTSDSNDRGTGLLQDATSETCSMLYRAMR